jgi:hypothetical protein
MNSGIIKASHGEKRSISLVWSERLKEAQDQSLRENHFSCLFARTSHGSFQKRCEIFQKDTCNRFFPHQELHGYGNKNCVDWQESMANLRHFIEVSGASVQWE